jgi:hypothetical protein
MRKKMLLCLCVLICAAAAAKDNLAVLPFTGGTAGDGETIAELFSFNRELDQFFSIIPRTSISQAVAKEQKFQMSAGMTDPDTIAAIGKQLGANYVVAGNIAKLGNLNLLIISILKIDELRQIAGDVQTYNKIEEIQSKLPGMVRNIINAAGPGRTPSEADKLAVARVEMGGNVDSRVADTLAQILSVYLIRSGKYLVYPRTETLAQVQAEYKNQLSGNTADENIVRMGRGGNPRLVLSVVARRLGDINMFNAAVIDLESSIQRIGKSVNYNTLDDGIRVMETLARELAGGVSGGSPPAAGRKPPGEQDTAAEMEAIAEASRAKAAGIRRNTRTETPAAGRQSGRAAIGYGALNLALGLGSFIQGDWGGGLTCVIGYGAAAGLIVWELSLAYEDDLAGIPGAVGLGVAGATVLFGFIRPMLYNRNHALAGIADGVNIAVVPGNRGEAAVRLSYTLRF